VVNNGGWPADNSHSELLALLYSINTASLMLSDVIR